MNNAWMELHGEYPRDPADDFCQECGQELQKGHCLNKKCSRQDRDYCAECGALTDVEDLKPDPYPVAHWLVCPKCYRASLSAMGAGICENPIHNAEGGDLICPDCGEAV